MLQVISALKGFAMEATDGRIGTVVDFLFDDTSWRVRWLARISQTPVKYVERPINYHMHK